MSVRTVYTCDRTSKSGAPAVHDVDEEIDTPLGWLQVIVTRVVANPEHTEAVQRTEAELAQLDQALAADGLTAEQRATTLAPVRAQREAAYPPEHTVQERVLHFHPEAVGDVLKALGVGGLA